MSMANFLLCSLRKRMNLMMSEVMQIYKKNEQECFCEKSNDEILIELLKKIKEGDIESSHFTRDEARRALLIYEYLKDAIPNEISECLCTNPIGDYDSIKGE